MATKKTIAIMGATGMMGAAIAKSLSAGNYRLLLFARHHDKVNQLAKEIKTANPSADVECAGCSFDASWEADIIIAAIPFQGERELAENIRQVATGKIVVSISNPFNETYDGFVTPADTSAGEEMQKLLPDSKVVKAFNTTLAASFAKNTVGGQQPDAFIAGNDAASLETVSELVRLSGFNPVIAGDITASNTLERMTLLMLQLNNRYQYQYNAGWKVLHN